MAHDRRISSEEPWRQVTVAIGIGLIALLSIGVLFMINGVGLFAPSRRPRPQDDPEVIAGIVARVTSAIGSAAAGDVAFTIDGSRRIVSAQSVDGAPIQAGADVVIERIDNQMAWVERWESVEARL